MIEFTDRYQALGIPYPNVNTMCRGMCEGTGMVPISRDEVQEPWLSLYREAHTGCTLLGAVRQLLKIGKIRKWGWCAHLGVCWDRLRCDGWHFVQCPECQGSGKRTSN